LRPQTAAQLAQALEFVPAEPWNEEQAMKWWQGNNMPAEAVSA
jgi:hypothetical protein